MTHYFLDSSALAKRYIPEIGTGWVQAITGRLSGHTVMVAQITQVEVVSAAQRRVRDGSITMRTAHATRLLIDRHCQREFKVIALVPTVVHLAKDLLEAYPLRAYDAVQLASAIEANRRLIAHQLAPLVFVSADTRLLVPAASEGLATDNPLAHP